MQKKKKNTKSQKIRELLKRIFEENGLKQATIVATIKQNNPESKMTEPLLSTILNYERPYRFMFDDLVDIADALNLAIDELVNPDSVSRFEINYCNGVQVGNSNQIDVQTSKINDSGELPEDERKWYQKKVDELSEQNKQLTQKITDMAMTFVTK